MHQLQEEKLSLGQTPDLSIVGTKVSSKVAFEENWLCYTEWASALTKAACEHFLKAAKIGVFLGEPHLVSNVAVYLWNYNQHLIRSDKLGELIPTFRTLLAHMRKPPKLRCVPPATSAESSLDYFIQSLI